MAPVRNFSVETHCSLTDLQDLWGSIRDGDYWTAFKRAVRILNDCMNPEMKVGGVTARGVASAPSAADTAGFDECCQNIRSWLDRNRSGDSTFPESLRADSDDEDSDSSENQGSAVIEMPEKLRNSDAPKITIDQVLAIVELIVSIFERWQKRRNGD